VRELNLYLQVARRIRKNDKPFGGIQLILCGDFFQLPPVSRSIPGEKSKGPKFCFQTKAWQNCMLNVFELKHVHRQTDNKFITILNKIRVGKCFICFYLKAKYFFYFVCVYYVIIFESVE